MYIGKKLINAALPLLVYMNMANYSLLSEKKIVDSECNYKFGSKAPWKCYLDLDNNGCFDIIVYDYDEDGIIDKQENIEEICINETG